MGGEKTPKRIDVTVTEDGFSPKRLTVKKGEPVTLVFTRRTDRTCAKDVVIYVDDTNTISRKLPLNQPVEVTVTFPKTGERGFACSMKMHGAAIMVE
jgi:plastocyanin domain-containing protein